MLNSLMIDAWLSYKSATQKKKAMVAKFPHTTSQRKYLRKLYCRLLAIDLELFWAIYITDCNDTASYYGYDYPDEWTDDAFGAWLKEQYNNA